MKTQSKNRLDPSANLLSIILKHECEWQEEDDGNISLLKPKIKNERIYKFFKKRLKQPYYYIHLDEIGSSTWKLIDGHRSVEAIGIEMYEKYGSDIEPVYERLGKFIGSLLRGRFISSRQ